MENEVVVWGKVNLGDVKRCYVDIKIDSICPNCQEPITADLSRDYISHPEVGDKDSVYFYCAKCGSDSSMNMIIGETILELKLFPNTIKCE